jgi:hypothetical protein
VANQPDHLLSDHEAACRDYVFILAEARLDDRIRPAFELDGCAERVSVQAQLALLAADDPGWTESLAVLRSLLAGLLAHSAQEHGLTRTSSRAAVHALAASLTVYSVRLARLIAGPASACTDPRAPLGAARVLRRLPPAQRRALEMRHLQNLPIPEIARRLGRSPAATSALLARGRKALRYRGP